MKLDFSSLAQPAAKTWGQVGTAGTPAVARLSVSPVTQTDVGTAGDKPANAVSARVPVMSAAEACPPVSPGCPHQLDADKTNAGAVSPMSPLVPTEESKVTKAPTDREALDERKQVGTGLSTCDGCVHLLPYGTCGEPVAAGLVPEFGIVWAHDGHGAACPAFNGPAPLTRKDQLCWLKTETAERSRTDFWDEIEIDPWAADGVRAGDLDELQEF